MHPETNNIQSDKRLVMKVSSFHIHRQQHTLQRVIDGTFRKSSVTTHYGCSSSNWSLASSTCTRKMCYWWLENILLGCGYACCEQFQNWNHWRAYIAERISNLKPMKWLHCKRNYCSCYLENYETQMLWVEQANNQKWNKLNTQFIFL